MIRLVLDTNIYVSGLFWGGLPGQLIDAIGSHPLIVLTSEPLSQELHRVLSRGKFLKKLAERGETVEAVMQRIVSSAILVEPAPVPAAAVRDPKDVMVLACAVGGRADYSVSGDQDLLELSAYANIPIITVTRCLELLSSYAE